MCTVIWFFSVLTLLVSSIGILIFWVVLCTCTVDVAAQASCFGFCGANSGSCWCDDACLDLQYQDCCSDAIVACKLPIIYSISPSVHPVVGGTRLAIEGINFGSSGFIAGVTYSGRALCLYSPTNNAANCNPGLNCTQLVGTATSLSCTVPKGSGGPSSFRVVYQVCLRSYLTPSGTCYQTQINSALSFSYSPPTVATLSPRTLNTNANLNITITGSNFAFGAVVFANQVPCITTFVSSTVVTFIAPFGSGGNIPVIVSIPPTFNLSLPFSLINSSIISFAYNPPVLQTISIVSGNTFTAGGAVISLTGSNFGPSNSMVVSINGSTCNLVPQESGHTSLKCIVPPGQGMSSVIVDANGQSSSSLFFSYAAPIISAVVFSGSPPTSGLSGGNPFIITLIGFSFGVFDAVVTLGSKNCPVVSQNHTVITCRLPAGQGTQLTIFVEVAGFTSLTYTGFSYGKPVVSNVFPLRSPTDGKVPITIIGFNFGTSATVTIGGNDCSILSTADSQIICTLPAGEGLNVPVVVTLLSQVSENLFFDLYAAPVFSSLNPILPISSDTIGGSLLTISGSNFGDGQSLGVRSVSIGSYSCTIDNNNGWTNNEIKCTIGPGQGLNLPVVVSVANQISSNTAFFSYNSPIISSVNPVNGSTEGGITITIEGSNFGVQSFISIGEKLCPISYQSHTQLTCTLAAGTGMLLNVSLTIGAETVVASSKFSFNPPRPYSISPKNGNTNFGTIVTIVGTSFGESGSVYFSESICQIISYSSTLIRCYAPAGQGVNIPVLVVSSLGLNALALLTYDYNPPVISVVSPNFGPTGPDSTLIVLSGQNFGTFNQIVTVGGNLCPLALGVLQTSTSLTCNVAPGSGVGYLITVNISSQIATSASTFSYNPPTISSIFPAIIGTIGGSLVTITGNSFGFNSSQAIVLVGENLCALVSINHTQIVCLSPEGQGLSATVQVSVNGQLSGTNSKISYGSPIITSLSPPTAGTSGGSLLTIFGTNFGSSISETVTTVLISGRKCTPFNVTHTQIVCIVPAGEGYNLDLKCLITEQLSNIVSFSYNAPSLDALMPMNGNTSGRFTVTLTGSNFGLNPSVSFGSSTCSITDKTDSRIICTAPAGQGINIPVLVSSAAQSSSSLFFNYGPPSISSCSPSIGVTNGGTLITLSGNNFGSSSLLGSVTIGGFSCISSSWTDFRIICLTPAGMGINQEIFVVASGQKSTDNILFQYMSPRVTSVSPLVGSTSGNFIVTIAGSNFGLAGVFTIGNSVCDYSSTGASGLYSHNLIVCTAPSGRGINLPLSLNVSGQIATFDSILVFSYDSPSLLSMAPLTGSTGGNYLVTIVGSSFDSSGIVRFGAINCTIYSWSHHQVIVYAPAGEGTNIIVSLTSVGLFASINTLIFSYSPSILTSLSPTTAPSVGGTLLTISGNNFGNSSTCTIGGDNCNVVVWSYTSIVCQVPPGSGTLKAIVVKTAGQVSNTILFSYAAPIINSLNPLTALTDGGTMLTLMGSSFGPASPGSFVNFGSVLCPLISWNHTTIVCVTPSGQGKNIEIRIVNGQLSNAILFSYTVPNPLSITPNHGPTGPNGILATVTIFGTSFGTGNPLPTVNFGGNSATVLSVNHSTIVCVTPPGSGAARQIFIIVSSQTSTNFVLFSYDSPEIQEISPRSIATQGGAIITVAGSSFSQTDAIVLIGGLPCPLISQSDSRILCTAPPGQGRNLDFIVNINGQSTSLLSSFSYFAPSITSLSPSTSPTNGQTIITLTGSSFGFSGSIFINGVSCVLVPGRYTHTSAQAVVPAGFGVDLVVTLVVASQSGNATQLFNYDPPVIISISPLSSPTKSFSTIMTVVGTSFSKVASVFISGQLCAPTGAGVSDNRIECSVPGGRGVSNPVTVVVGSRTSQSLNFVYEAPSIFAISTSGIAAGNVPVTLFGTNFGLINDAVVLFGSSPCPILSINDSYVVCTLPPAVGTNFLSQIVMITVSNQQSLPVLFSYGGPEVFALDSSVTGCLKVGNTLNRCPFSSTTLITIIGINFGDLTTSPVVTVGGKNCDDVTHIFEAPFNRLTCIVPKGTGRNLAVTVSVAGLSGSANLFSYAGPEITPGSLKLGINGFASSSIVVTNPLSETVYFSGSSLSGSVETKVTFGPVDSPNNVGLYSCINVVVINTTLLSCSIPSNAVGVNMVFQVTVVDSVVGSLVSDYGTDTISFQVPLIVNSTIERVTSPVPGASSIQGIYSEGELVNFKLLHVGIDSTKILSVVYGTIAETNLYSCSNVLLTNYEPVLDRTTLSCLTSSGSGGPYSFRVLVLNVWTDVGTDTYYYPEIPKVYAVSGCADVGNITTNCMTTGGTVITVYGDSFASSDMTVKIGSTICGSLNFISSKMVSCVLPAGTGLSRRVFVIVGSLFSSGEPLLSYSIAILTSITGCPTGGNMDCLRDGGNLVTLTGINFGVSGSIVLVGGLPCKSLVHDENSPSTIVSCFLNSGVDINVPVVLIQGSGEVSANQLQISYSNCPAGTTAQQSTSVCSVCPAGKFSDPSKFTNDLGLDSCIVCSSGTYSFNGSSSCIACLPGSYSKATSTVGATTCTLCDAGSFSSIPPLKQCSFCPEGTYSSVSGATRCFSCFAGNVSTSPGATSCSSCEPGTYSAITQASGVSLCTPCQPGSYSFSPGSTSCILCSAVSQNQLSQSICLDCEAGAFSAQIGQVSCQSCTIGYYTNATGLPFCFACGPGTISSSPSGATSCSNCGTGYYSESFHSAVCLECPIGRFGNVSGSSSCTACSIGTFNNERGWKFPCEFCPAGSFTSSSEATACTSCPASTYAAYSGASECLFCASGKYQGSESATDCVLCDPGSISFRGIDQIACPAGFYTNLPGSTLCLPCPAGSYSPSPSNGARIGATICTLCSPGFFMSGTRASSCAKCSLGYIQPQFGGTTCIACESGSISENSITCNNCSAGSFASKQGLFSCTICPLGTYQNLAGQSTCAPCAAGTFNSALDLVSARSCSFCPIGKFASGFGQGFCVDADVGYYSNSSGLTALFECGLGTGVTDVNDLVIGSSFCPQCRPGYFSNSYHKPICSSCPQGAYSDIFGSSSCNLCSIGSANENVASSSCKTCLAGSFASNKGSIICSACAAGSYSADNSSSCTLCSVGKYQPNIGQSTCLECKAGQYALDVGSTESCTPCRAGYYTTFNSSTICFSCSPGHVSSNIGQSFCSECVPGKYAATSGAAICESCPSGTFSDIFAASICTFCDAGKFQPLRGQIFCSTCSPGKFQEASGQIFCKDCKSGYFSSIDGASSCTACRNGTFSSVGASTCQQCDIGFFNPNKGSDTCLPCPFGTFSLSMGVSACIDCAVGKYSSNAGGSTFCLDCSPGTYVDTEGSAFCINCRAGFYSNVSGLSSCSPCSVGSFQATDFKHCELCSPGSFVDKYAQVSCNLCSPGTFSSVHGASVCSDCNNGQYQDEFGKFGCKACPLGKYLKSAGQTGCTECEPGTFNSAQNQTFCTLCEPGFYSSSQTGTQRINCVPCSAGTYMPFFGAFSCFPCPVGTFSNVTKASACLSCVTNTFQPASGQTTCNNCPAGQFVTGIGNIACFDCPAGRFGLRDGSCENCPVGTSNLIPKSFSCKSCSNGFESLRPGSLTCSACAVGYYAANGINCQACLAGSISSVSGSTACSQCPPGTFQPLSAQFVCIPCGSGFYSDAFGSTTCNSCVEGTYSVLSGAIGSTTCTKCAPGTFNNVRGLDSCPVCAPGLFSNLFGATSCNLCASGSFSSSIGESACNLCSLGKFSAFFGSRTCLDCSLGSFSDIQGASSCNSCLPGTFQSLTGMSSCRACLIGSYMPLLAQPKCLDCPAGSFNNASLLSSCFLCPKGTISSSSGSARCEKCSVGTFIDIEGQIRCNSCPIGKFSAIIGSTACINCLPGSFNIQSGKSFCQQCSTGKYQPNSGAIECHECRIGEYSNITGLSVCFDCNPGSHNFETGRTECRLCEIGTYAAISKQISCSLCAPGLYSNTVGLSSCISCNAGFYGIYTGQSSCLPCAQGKYSLTAGQTSCPDCNPGSFSNVTSSSRCFSCFRGTYVNKYRATSCISCPVGTDTSAIGSIECEQCEPGRYSDKLATSSCMLCPAGSWNTVFNQTVCLDCPAGFFSGEGQKSCDPCMPGTYNPFFGRSTCIGCTPGYFQTNQSAVSGCNPCPAGSFTSLFFSSVCSPCPLGTFVSGIGGLSACLNCPAGKFGNSTSLSRCFDCPIGTYSSNAGMFVCSPCQPGYKSSNKEGSTTCIACEVGTYQDRVGQMSCLSCPIRSFGNSIGKRVCDSCPPGYYSDDLGLSSCIACPVGKFQSNVGSTSCVECTPGFYSDKTALPVCLSCIVGTFQNSSGNTFCHDCVAGSFQDSLGATSCLLCDIGLYSHTSGQDSCIPCPVGNYGDVPGLSTCFGCNAGTYADSIQSTACLNCTLGKYAPVSYQAACSFCPPGTYSTEARATYCSRCRPGTFAVTSGNTVCSNCDVAYYSDIFGASLCSPCEPGTFGNLVGQTSCQYCSKSYYSSKAAQTACSFCEPGSEAPLEGMNRCSLCSPGNYWGIVNSSAICIQCMPGYYNPSYGATICNACPPGSSTNGISGALDCPDCPASQIAPSNATALCSTCDVHASPDPSRVKCVCTWGYYYDAKRPIGSSCVFCPVGADCSSPGNEIYTLPLAPGYWRKDDFDLKFYKCRTQDACLGGRYETGRVIGRTLPKSFALVDGGEDIFVESNSSVATLSKSVCKQYHTGPLCQICEPNNRKTGAGICTPCPSYANSMVFFVGMGVVILIALLIQMTALLKTSSELLHDLKEYDDEDLVAMTREDANALERLRESANVTIEERSSRKVMRRLLNRILSRSINNELRAKVYRDIEINGENSINLVNKKTDITESRQLLRQMTLRPDLVIDEVIDESTEDMNQLDEEIKDVHKNHVGKIYHEDGTSLSTANDLTWKMKIMLGFFQIITNIGDSVQVPWPNSFVSVVRYLSVINFDFVSISSAECVVDAGYYKKFLLSILVPLGIVLGLLILYLVPKYLTSSFHPLHPIVRVETERQLGRCLSSAEEDEYVYLDIKAARRRSKIRFYRMMEFFLFLIYPTISSNVLALFVCQNINGVDYLVADMSQLCYSDTWYSYIYIGATFSVLYPVGIPLFFFYRLYLHREKLEAASVRAENGFLYDGYSRESWFFEMVDMSHKLILCSLLPFAPTSSQLIIGIVIIIAMLIILLVIRPYKSRSDDLLHLWVQAELFLLILAGYSYQSIPVTTTAVRVTEQQIFFDYIMTFILISICLGMFALFLFQTYKFFFKWYRTWWDAKHPEEAAIRILKESLIDYQYIDRRNMFEDDETRALLENNKKLAVANGMKMKMNPLFESKIRIRKDIEDTEDLNESSSSVNLKYQSFENAETPSYRVKDVVDQNNW